MLDRDFAAHISDQDGVIRAIEVVQHQHRYAIQVLYDDYLALEERTEFVTKPDGDALLFPNDSRAREFLAFIDVAGTCPPD